MSFMRQVYYAVYPEIVECLAGSSRIDAYTLWFSNYVQVFIRYHRFAHDVFHILEIEFTQDKVQITGVQITGCAFGRDEILYSEPDFVELLTQRVRTAVDPFIHNRSLNDHYSGG